MTIRYKCEDCGSVLKIKDELAGTDGHCPKCKTAFAVPALAPNDDAGAAVATAPADDGDFDPVAFLMDGGGPPSPAPPTPARENKAVAEDAVAEDEPPKRRRKRSRVTAGESAAESADAMLGATASSNAKHLLTRSMEESRVRAAEMPEDREEPGFDYAELAKLVGLRGLPAIAAVILVTIGVYWMSSGWLNDFDLPDLGRVSGVVTKGGQPVAGAEVTFTPLDVDASSATAISDENGEYTLQYLEDVDGAVVGQNRVRISVVDERGRELLAPENVFDRRSNEVWMVESGRQEVPIDITRPFSSPPAATDE